MSQRSLIETIADIAKVRLYPATPLGNDTDMAVMPLKRDKPQRYLLNETGDLIGLNLAGSNLTDSQWEKILQAPGFKPELLKALNLRGNKLKKSPVTGAMQVLKHLDLCDNQLQEFSPANAHVLEQVQLYGNEMSSPPLEVVNQGKEALLNYFRELETEGSTKIYEAKILIVGAGGAGKTTLMRRLLDGEKAVMPSESESTHGIEVKDLAPFDCGGEQPFRAHIWDFGGQEIYHATHQFFLTKRSLYLLVSDPRKEDTDFDYWLEIIQLLGGESPVIIIQNEKSGHKKDINLTGLQAQFPNVASLHSLDLSKSDKLDKLIKDIHNQLINLPHIGETLPKSWAHVRTVLEKKRQHDQFIDASAFYKICEEHGEVNEEAVLLGRYLHDLGFILHFQEDPVLKHTVILNNTWATEGVYAVVDNPELKHQKKGKFSKADAVAIWNSKESEKGKVLFKGMHDELLQLMLKFEICYRLLEQGEDYIAPQLLPAIEPEVAATWPQRESLHLIFRYGFMPKGLMSRLIVRLNHLIRNHMEDAWQSGAILHRGESANARILETFSSKDIHLSARGKEAKELLSRISEEVERLNVSYEKIVVEKLVPCICQECLRNLADKDWQKKKTVHLFDYNRILLALNKDIKEMQCQITFDRISTKGLIESVSPKGKANRRVFISYADADLKYLKTFKKQLSPLVMNGLFETWDASEIKGGEDQKKIIDSELSRLDIFIFLASADYVSSEAKMNELHAATIRCEWYDTVVVPIILRPFNWNNLPFAKFKPLPSNGKPITQWDNEDAAWEDVVQQLQALLK